MAINEEGFGTDTLTITDVLLIGTQGTVQRLLQDEQTGQIYPVNNVFVSIINNAMVEDVYKRQALARIRHTATTYADYLSMSCLLYTSETNGTVSEPFRQSAQDFGHGQRAGKIRLVLSGKLPAYCGDTKKADRI